MMQFDLSRSLTSPLAGLSQFLATERPLKMMKNTFYFIAKALFVLKIIKLRSLNFCPDFFGYARKAKLISKFMTSSTRN